MPLLCSCVVVFFFFLCVSGNVCCDVRVCQCANVHCTALHSRAAPCLLLPSAASRVPSEPKLVLFAIHFFAAKQRNQSHSTTQGQRTKSKGVGLALGVSRFGTFERGFGSAFCGESTNTTGKKRKTKNVVVPSKKYNIYSWLPH